MKIEWQKIGIKELAALISGKLRENGIDAILVGGACVSIYTKNRYQSFSERVYCSPFSLRRLIWFLTYILLLQELLPVHDKDIPKLVRFIGIAHDTTQHIRIVLLKIF